MKHVLKSIFTKRMKMKLLITIALAFVDLSVKAQCTAVAGPNTTICLGQTTTLSASANPTAVSYSWVPGTGLSCTNCSNPIASPAFSNTYTVYTTDANGCTASATVNVTVANVPFVSAVGSTTICVGCCTAQLAANASNGTAPYSYYWSPPNTLNNPNSQYPIASPTTTTNYTITVTDAYGCKDDTTTTVYAQTPPTASFTYMISGNTLTCFNTSTSNSTNYYWDFGDGNSSVIQNPVHVYSPFSSTYSVCLVVFDLPCFDSTSATITILGIDDYYLSSLIDIYPNPFSESAVIHIDDAQLIPSELKIYDLLGKEVKSYRIQNAEEKIYRNNLSSGLYYYRLLQKEQIVGIGKLMIE